MKKLIILVLTAVLIATPSTIAFAKNKNSKKNDPKKFDWSNDFKWYEEDEDDDDDDRKWNKKEFKLKDSPVFKYGKYQLPLAPIVKAMDSGVEYNKDKVILTITKNDTEIIIDFKDEVVYVNGVKDTKSDIFNSKKKNNGKTVLIKYIAEILDYGLDLDDDEVIVKIPKNKYLSDIKITPIAANNTDVIKNTLNSSSIALEASAKIKAGHTHGSKAELYVGSKLVATDNVISPKDTKVTFTTSDGTPTNKELMASVPKGGEVTVKLYNEKKELISSKTMKEKLVVDYVSPTLKSVIGVNYIPAAKQIKISVRNAGAVGDKVNLDMISIFDTKLRKIHTLDSSSNKGSEGIVKSSTSLVINLGERDYKALSGFGKANMYLSIWDGSLISDQAGNLSPKMPLILLPVKIIK